MMEILSHRGLWETPEEKNADIAFRRSFDLGFGTETDLRDHGSEIVIAHDMPDGREMRLSDLLEIMAGRNLTLALNIKADGLSEAVRDNLAAFGHDNYFVFDMSVPDMVRQLACGMRVFTGLSDIQPNAPLLDACEGVWLDCFKSDWFGPGTIDRLLEQGKRVAVVSADLHSRDCDAQWEIIKMTRMLHSGGLLLCTDKPQMAASFFGEAR